MTVRRIALGALTPLVLLALIPAAAGAKNGTVMVSASGNSSSSVTVRLADLGTPDVDEEYELRSGLKPIKGYSLAKVLTGAAAEAGGWLDLATIPSVDVDGPSESPIPIGRSKIFDAGARPPVFYEKNGTTVFLMPGSPGAEYVFRGAPVGVKVGSGKVVFKVALSASPKKPRKGQKVKIDATVKGAPAGAALSFRWRFSDGTVKTTSAPQVVHSFSRQGQRSVVVTVTGETGTGQGALAIDVADGGGGGGENSPTPSSGGDSTGGGSGTGGLGGSGTGYGGGDGSGFGGFPESGSTGIPEAAVPPPETRDQSVEQPPSDFEEVSGVLINPAASASAAAPEAGVVEKPDPVSDDAFGLSGEAATLLGVGLLLALGGLIETRVLVRRP